MGLLANVLPGIRELRAPLSAGYLWIIAAALFWRDDLKGLDTSPVLVGDIAGVATWLGRPASLAALTFTAYVIGLLSTWLSSGALRLDKTLNRRSRDLLKGLVERSIIQQVSGREDVRARLLKDAPASEALVLALRSTLPTAVKRDIVAAHFDTEQELTALVDDLELMPARLVRQKSSVLGAWDRFQAEAEFRAGIALPLAPLAILIGRYSAWWVGVVVTGFALVLALQARTRRQAAVEVLAEDMAATGWQDVEALDGLPTLTLADPKLDSHERAVIRTRSLASYANPLSALEWHKILTAAGEHEAAKGLATLARDHVRGVDEKRECMEMAAWLDRDAALDWAQMEAFQTSPDLERVVLALLFCLRLTRSPNRLFAETVLDLYQNLSLRGASADAYRQDADFGSGDLNQDLLRSMLIEVQHTQTPPDRVIEVFGFPEPNTSNILHVRKAFPRLHQQILEERAAWADAELARSARDVAPT